MRSPGVNEFGDLFRHLILPASILAVMNMARNMRYTRFSMLEVVDTPSNDGEKGNTGL